MELRSTIGLVTRGGLRDLAAISALEDDKPAANRMQDPLTVVRGW